jgi:hypothetical protein
MLFMAISMQVKLHSMLPHQKDPSGGAALLKAGVQHTAGSLRRISETVARLAGVA